MKSGLWIGVPLTVLRYACHPHLPVDPIDVANNFAVAHAIYDADRIDGFNGISYGVGNRIYSRSFEDGGANLIADFYVSNQFNAEDGKFGSIFLNARAYPWERLHVWGSLGIDPHGGNISEGIFQLGFRAPSGHAIRVAYRYLREIPRFFEDFKKSSDRFEDFTETFSSINQIFEQQNLIVLSLRHLIESCL